MAILDAHVTDHVTGAAVRDHALSELRAAMSTANFADAERCAARLRAELPHQGRLERNLVLVAFGGGKDSAYMLAFVRAIQLLLWEAHGTTFRLRVATNRHAGMPRPVMENVDRTYRALRLPGDADCELLLIDGNEVSEFDVDSPQHPAVVRRNRLDILMTGHRTGADGRPTFCNACNLSVVNAFGLAASYGDGADVMVTGDSRQEQRQYTQWIDRLARRLTPDRAAGGRGLGRFLATIDGLAEVYFADIHGADATDVIAERRVRHEVPNRLKFFSIYEDTEYAAWDHLDLLTRFLGFEFDELAFSFTESDCGNPALMAHLRALRCERVYDRTYAEGMAEYVDFALDLMRGKDFPAALIDQMRARYDGPDAVVRMRRAAAEYAIETFGLNETQLICMAYAPFLDGGAELHRFLSREHPALIARIDAIHRLLADKSAQAPDLTVELERISGLTIAQLRLLYRRTPRPGVIETVLSDDPHKAVIKTRHSRGGPVTLEQISGR